MTRLRLSISSGTGPVEVRTFVRLLAAELSVACSRRGAQLTQSVVHGLQREPHSVDLWLEGERTSLADLVGTHALLMHSPSRQKRDRKRWFVGVSCVESVALHASPLRTSDVRFETCRSGGAGGQHVNRTESAVRATHVPSGISVRVESERSQHQNKARALALLTHALAERDATRRARDARDRRDLTLRVERGRAVAVWRIEGAGLRRVDQSEVSHAR